jgi:hypothetical protein
MLGHHVAATFPLFLTHVNSFTTIRTPTVLPFTRQKSQRSLFRRNVLRDYFSSKGTLCGVQMIELCHQPVLSQQAQALEQNVGSALSRGLRLRSSDWSIRAERIRLPDCGLPRITSVKQRSVTDFTPLN